MIKDYVVSDEFVKYSGPFELKELYKLITGFLRDHHYTKVEKDQFEKRTEEGRLIELDFRPYKIVSEAIKMEIFMLIKISNLKDISVELHGKKKTIQQADVMVQFRSFIYKDYVSYWEKNPVIFFIKTMIDKYIFKTHLADFRDELVDDTRDLQYQIKSFLNLYTRK
ncbi:hypothetical protein KY334_00815 [Candidatus Woesearchaeota archaeon]|nr:hypothetical protein [Candidatus Woesearchaeota archaeon]